MKVLKIGEMVKNGAQPNQAGQVCARHVAGRPAYLLPDGLTKVR